MALVKCPRCELNYMNDTDKFCSVCLRDMHGDFKQDEVELCTICNEEPVMPGKDICLNCFKEMKEGLPLSDGEANEADVEEDEVPEIDEIIPASDDVLPESEFVDMESLDAMEDEDDNDEDSELDEN